MSSDVSSSLSVLDLRLISLQQQTKPPRISRETEVVTGLLSVPKVVITVTRSHGPAGGLFSCSFSLTFLVVLTVVRLRHHTLDPYTPPLRERSPNKRRHNEGRHYRKRGTRIYHYQKKVDNPLCNYYNH